MVSKVPYLLVAARQEILSLSHRQRKESCNRELRKTSRQVQYIGPNLDRSILDDVRHSSWQFDSDRLVYTRFLPWHGNCLALPQSE
ncbi:hypothetical protein SAMN05216228_10913 [Rhizobium tibeticum]|uniref:Uncharacterized protein n=1 Tax=Rhizobium tibeticum TaxID=501024 RepID=A0A1H8X100_9HYPH|nr:hypothetical protein RTCCBAU85039_6794 [Rhizobium tibeticum]SEP33635.1 hypothetical protein SAMN05216228_10913 [Rhizobium tibeticum]